MARGNKSTRLDLHDALSRRAYNNAILCTYTFDPLFFEATGNEADDARIVAGFEADGAEFRDDAGDIGVSRRE